MVDWNAPLKTLAGGTARFIGTVEREDGLTHVVATRYPENLLDGNEYIGLYTVEGTKLEPAGDQHTIVNDRGPEFDVKLSENDLDLIRGALLLVIARSPFADDYRALLGRLNDLFPEEKHINPIG